jgi:hypothetical protein
VSIVAFLWSTTYSSFGPIKYVFREVAVTAGASGIPIILLSTAVLLPVSRRVDLIGTGGVIACLLATAQFAAVYPRAAAWNQSSSLIVSVYAIGAIIVLTAAGTALSGYRIEMVVNATATQESATDNPETTSESEDEEDEISDERVERQIESAMAAAELNWGGVERDDGQTLQFTANEDEYDARNVTKAGVKESRGGSVDDAVEGLQGLRGDKRKTESGSGTLSRQRHSQTFGQILMSQQMQSVRMRMNRHQTQIMTDQSSHRHSNQRIKVRSSEFAIYSVTYSLKVAC